MCQDFPCGQMKTLRSGSKVKAPRWNMPFVLVLPVEHRDMGSNLAFLKPCQKRAGAVSLVRRQHLRRHIMGFGHAVQQGFSGYDFLRRPRQRRLDIDDDAMRGIDHIVVEVGKPSRPFLGVPCGGGVRGRQVLGLP